MKICEITDKNLTWIGLTGIDTEFQVMYNTILLSFNTIVKAKHKSKYPIILLMIDDLNQTISVILNTSFPDKDDPDIINLKIKAEEIRTHLTKLSLELSA